MIPAGESSYTLETRSDYIVMRITGVYNSRQFLGYPQIMLDACRKADVKKILVDATLVDFSNLSTMERYLLGEEFGQVVSYHLAIAILVREELITNFLETVATNRGAKMFVSSENDKALAWLASA